MRSLAGFALVSMGVVALASARCSADEQPREIADETQLFLDDWIVERMDGLTRTLHRPQKQGLIKLADGSDWDRGSVYLGNVVCRDKAGRFHMAYRYYWDDPEVAGLSANIGEDKAHWFRESVAYATSDDGIRWTKPSLGLIDGPAEFRKEGPYLVAARLSKDNNLGVPFDFIYDLHAHGNVSDPEKRFLLRLARKDDTHPFAKDIEIQLCFAADWPDFVNDPDWRMKLTQIEGGKLSPRGFRSVAGFDEQAGEWFAVSQDSIGRWKPRGGRDIARYATRDLVNWTGPELVLPVAADESREPRDTVEYMDMGASRVGGRKSGAWLGQLVIFHSDRTNPQYQMPRLTDVWRKGETELRLVVSRDAGKSWQRVGGKQVWLPHHEELHGYDRLVFASSPVRVGDELWLYYTGWDGDHLVYNRDGTLFDPGYLRTARTARATLRWDGYLSLDAADRDGTLVTRPLKFNGAECVVNLHAPRGDLRAELLDAEGKPIPGFALNDCVPVTGDGVELPVRWRSQAALASLAARPLQVRFVVRNGSLYSFRFREKS